MSTKSVASILFPEDIVKRMFTSADLTQLEQVVQLERGVARDATIAITGWGSKPFTTELLDQLPNLKLIAHTAGSVKFLVNDAVFDRGIRVTNAASANALPVAQFTVAMMVSALKQVPWIGKAYAAGNRDEVQARRAVCRELMDLEVGLIGASRIGRLVIGMLKAMPRLRVKIYDPYLSADEANELGVELVDLEAACRCEVVSIHAPSTPQTRHMFDAKVLSYLPDHAVLINTSRGALIDEAALVAEVNRRPLYVALDVTDPEPPPRESPLWNAPNILITPHVAGAMQQGCKDMGRLVIDEIRRFLANEPLQHEVTRAMLPTQA